MDTELQPGAELAGYRIDELLGIGGMGHVYRATPVAGGDGVALKVLLPQLAGDLRFRARFERESRLARQLDHPHVIAVRDAGEQEGRLYLAMDLAEGLDLEAVLIDRGPLHPGHAALIISQVASALDAAAALGLVHRDVKPGNVIVAERDGAPHAYLADFGLSKRADSQSGLTGTGQWVGTIDYAAPEQLQAQQVDQRTDVYALGALLYRTLTAEVPFPRDREVDIMMAHLSEPPPRPSAGAQEVPDEFDPVVARAMAKEPDDRYPSAGELGRDTLAAAEPAGAPPPWGAAGVKPRRRVDPDAPTVA